MAEYKGQRQTPQGLSADDNKPPQPEKYASMEGPLALDEYIVSRIGAIRRLTTALKCTNLSSSSQEKHSTRQELLESLKAAISSSFECPRGVTRNQWIYANMRQLLSELNSWVALMVYGAPSNESSFEQVPLASENQTSDQTKNVPSSLGPCVCETMSCTSDYQFMCAHADGNKACSALDYTRHLLSSTASILSANAPLTAPLFTPSSSSSTTVPPVPSFQRSRVADALSRSYVDLFRRLYRVLAHGHIHHPDLFRYHESRTFLFLRFVTLARSHDLLTDRTMIPLIHPSSIEIIFNNGS